mgnify:CR=1 FL=1
MVIFVVTRNIAFAYACDPACHQGPPAFIVFIVFGEQGNNTPARDVWAGRGAVLPGPDFAVLGGLLLVDVG